MIEEKTSKNIKIKWKIKLPPGIQKSDCTLAEYKISFMQKGTLLAPRLDAEVDIHYLSKSKQFYIQSLSGPSAEVYNFLLSHSRKRDMLFVLGNNQKAGITD